MLFLFLLIVCFKFSALKLLSNAKDDTYPIYKIFIHMAVNITFYFYLYSELILIWEI